MAEPGSANVFGLVLLFWCCLVFLFDLKFFPLTPALSPKGGEGEREPIYVDFNI